MGDPPEDDAPYLVDCVACGAERVIPHPESSGGGEYGDDVWCKVCCEHLIWMWDGESHEALLVRNPK